MLIDLDKTRIFSLSPPTLKLCPLLRLREPNLKAPQIMQEREKMHGFSHLGILFLIIYFPRND